jgi:anti-anti-sigma factor
LEYVIEGTGRGRIVRILGKLQFGDYQFVQSMEEILNLKSIDDLTFDFSDLTVIDSVGLGILIKISKIANSLNKSISVKNANDEILRLFKIFKLNEILHVDGAI